MATLLLAGMAVLALVASGSDVPLVSPFQQKSWPLAFYMLGVAIFLALLAILSGLP